MKIKKLIEKQDEYQRLGALISNIKDVIDCLEKRRKQEKDPDSDTMNCYTNTMTFTGGLYVGTGQLPYIYKTATVDKDVVDLMRPELHQLFMLKLGELEREQEDLEV